jgi:hypothetical protein
MSLTLHNGRSRDLIAEIAAKIRERSQVNLPAQPLRKLQLHPGHVEQSRRFAGLELDQDIDVALAPKTGSQDRTKEGQLLNVIAPSEVVEIRGRHREHGRIHCGSPLTSYQGGKLR